MNSETSTADSSAGTGAVATPSPEKAPSRASLFFRGAAFDFVLVLVASTALVMTLSYGFESAPDLRGNPLVCAGIALPLLLVLFAGSWSKRALVPAALGAVVYGVAAIVVLTMLSPDPSPVFYNGAVNDVSGNYFVFALVAVAIPALTYLLSRRRIGALVLLVGGVLLCEFVQFLYRDWATTGNGVAVFLVALVSLIALFIYQGYRSSAYAARRLKKTSFGAASGISVGVAAVGTVVGVAVFALVISGLGLSTLQIKPFKDYYKRPVIEYSGAYTNQLIEDENRKTSKLSEQKSDTRTNSEGGSNKQSTDPDDTQSSQSKTQAGQTTSLDQSNWNQQFSAINYQQLVLSALLLAIPIVAALVLFLLYWRSRRKRRLEKIQEKPNAYKVWYLYQFLLERLRRMGVPKQETLTNLEFAMASRAAMQPYAQGTGGVDFLAVTLAYQRACYDEKNVSDEDYRLIERFYRAFFKNARGQTGFFKWAFWRFWRI